MDQTKPLVGKVELSNDRTEARIWVDGLVQGHVHSFDLAALLSDQGESLVHPNAYYTLNEIPGKQD